ncbi:MAG: electron transfer flavoprotein subunit alpha/FixB family protein [Deltaproteobacteria bacterium]|nr:electron transfer flavoprotein subunit alpha/FixB family protein [Deltaproteobacteria bacterium]
MRRVLVWIEITDGVIAQSALEALGKARELAAPGNLYGIIIGDDNCCCLAEEANAYGVDEVFVARNASLKFYQSDFYPTIFTAIARHVAPTAIIIGGSPLGMELAPDVAARLDTGLTAHCIELSWENTARGEVLKQTVAGWGGNMRVDIICPMARPQMATICQGFFPPAKQQVQHRGTVTPWKVEVAPDDCRVKIIKMIKGKSDNSLQNADIVVAGGFGMLSAGGFDLIAALAKTMGAQIAGTRAAYDQGWIEAERVIGQSGVSIAPKVLIIAGASGAVHFTTGFQGAETVIAIDKNPTAPIFTQADFGVVGDAQETITALIKELEA